MEIKKNRTSFIFYYSFYEAIKNLSEEDQLKTYNLIFEYCFNQTIPKQPKNNLNISMTIFQLIKPNIDANNKRYFANIENGKKGGAPLGNCNAKTTQKQPKNNPKTTQKQPKTTFNEDVLCIMNNVDVDVDVDVDKEKNIVINNNIKKEYLNFYNKIENKKEYAEFVYLTEKEAEQLINEFGKLYFDKAISYLSIWKQEKLNIGDKKSCKGDDNLKIRKWVISKVMEDFKKQDYEAYRKYENTINKIKKHSERKSIIQRMVNSDFSWKYANKKAYYQDLISFSDERFEKEVDNFEKWKRGDSK